MTGQSEGLAAIRVLWGGQQAIFTRIKVFVAVESMVLRFRGCDQRVVVMLGELQYALNVEIAY